MPREKVFEDEAENSQTIVERSFDREGVAEVDALI